MTEASELPGAPTAAATMGRLQDLLASISGTHAATVGRHARHLRKAGLLPAEGEEITATHAATLLAAVMGGRAPTEAVQAAKVFAALPMIRTDDYFEDARTGQLGATCQRPEDVAVPAGGGEHWATISQSFLGALARYIDGARVGASYALVDQIAVQRNLAAPLAIISVSLVKRPEEVRQARLSYGLGEHEREAYTMGAIRMQTWVHMPGFAIREIGDLLAGRSAAATPALMTAPVKASVQ